MPVLSVHQTLDIHVHVCLVFKPLRNHQWLVSEALRVESSATFDRRRDVVTDTFKSKELFHSYAELASGIDTHQVKSKAALVLWRVFLQALNCASFTIAMMLCNSATFVVYVFRSLHCLRSERLRSRVALRDYGWPLLGNSRCCTGLVAADGRALHRWRCHLRCANPWTHLAWKVRHLGELTYLKLLSPFHTIVPYIYRIRSCEPRPTGSTFVNLSASTPRASYKIESCMCMY